MRPIKFDLPLNGTKIATLEQLEENLTPEIIGHFHSGKLAKWLRARSLTEQAEVVDAVLAANNEREVQLFKSLCEVFVSEVDENDAREAINDYKNSLPSSGNAVDEDMEVVKSEFKKEKTALEQKIAELEKEKDELIWETTNRCLMTAKLNTALGFLCLKLQLKGLAGAKSVSIVELESILKDTNYEELNEEVEALEQKYSGEQSDDTNTEQSDSTSDNEIEDYTAERYIVNQELLNLIDKEANFYVITSGIPKQKLDNATNEYGRFGIENEKPLVLFDDTVWGSADTGLLLSEHSLCCKYTPLFTSEKNAIRLNEVWDVGVEEEKTLIINGTEFARMTLWESSSVRIFATFLKDYLNLA